MPNKLKIIFQNKDVLLIDKPPGIVVIDGQLDKSTTLLEELLQSFPDLKKVNERAGILHRLDKDTSGLVLVAKNKKNFEFLKKSFQKREIEKKYIALVIGNLKEKKGEIKTLIGRSPKNRKKQKAFLPYGPEAKKKGLREAETKYRVLKRYSNGKNYYTLVEAIPKTGRKHQIRAHFVYIGHPVAGDKVYGFKNQPTPKGLCRHFLHASYLKFRLPDGQEKEFNSALPQDLKKAINQLKEFK